MDSNYDVQNIYKIVNGSIIKGTATKEKIMFIQGGKIVNM